MIAQEYVNKKLHNQKLCFVGLQLYSEISKVNELWTQFMYMHFHIDVNFLIDGMDELILESENDIVKLKLI